MATIFILRFDYLAVKTENKMITIYRLFIVLYLVVKEDNTIFVQDRKI